MKKIILIVVCFLPLLSYSQKTNPSPSKIKSTEVSKIDTVITKDPDNPVREFWVIHNLRGNVRSRGAMLNGKKDGVWREYSESSGILNRLVEYKNGVQNGVCLAFGPSGNIQSDENYFNDKKNGERIVFGNFAGKIKLVENYKDDVLEGIKKTYYEDGKLQEEGTYKNGQRHGIVKWYKQNGAPTLEYTYDNGILNGPAKVYDDVGKLKQEGFYSNNNEQGEWKEFQDSILVKRIIYKDGQIVREIPAKK